jgi:hypothetical protein
VEGRAKVTAKVMAKVTANRITKRVMGEEVPRTPTAPARVTAGRGHRSLSPGNGHVHINNYTQL